MVNLALRGLCRRVEGEASSLENVHFYEVKLKVSFENVYFYDVKLKVSFENVYFYEVKLKVSFENDHFYQVKLRVSFDDCTSRAQESPGDARRAQESP